MHALLALTLLMQPAHSFEVKGDAFLLDGKPFVIRSGEMHYPRVPETYWRPRMKQAKAMGLNTICTYVFWNLHEKQQGAFDFKGNLDLGKFLRVAQEEGLFTIVRPGPYVCTELDLGGFPAWLLKDRGMKVRSNDPRFLAHVERYMKAVGKVVQPHLVANGGAVILAQVENEYGSYGADHVYMGKIRDIMQASGFTGQLFTSDGPGQGMLNGGTLPGIPATVNFGGGAENAFKELAKFRPGGPRMIGEYWCGWFDHWGKPHHTTSAEGHLKDIEWCLKNDVSFNLYMFHGGTNWGFMQGSNGSATEQQVDTTSYDYDAPVDESGRLTAKYWAFRKAIQAAIKERLPEPPTDTPAIAIKPFKLTESASLFDQPAEKLEFESPMNFEAIDQAHGMALYQTQVDGPGAKRLRIDGLMDYATVFVNGTRVGVLDRRMQQSELELALPSGLNRLDILVESLSRINFGGNIPNERKGILGQVTLDGKRLTGWTHAKYPLESVKGIKFKKGTSQSPVFYRGAFNVEVPGDTFLDLRGGNKGFVWVNGRNLGRFWRIGPQQTLFLPGCWMKKGRNEVVVYDDGPAMGSFPMQGLDKPILDDAKVDASKLRRKPGQTVSFEGLAPAAEGELPNSGDAQRIGLDQAPKGRYLAFEALSEVNGEVWTTIAEIHAFGPMGKPVDRKGWKVVYADSEEVDSENGSAANAIDGKPGTIWHTNWSGSATKHPHVIVIDLGQVVGLSGISVTPRQVGVNGRVKGYRVYLSESPFKGL